MISTIFPSPTLKQLIENRIKLKGLKRSDLIRLMGYSNISKGLRRLDRFFHALEAPDAGFVSKLQIVLDINTISLEKTISETRDAIEDNAKKSFVPHLVICVDFHPQPWFAAQVIQAECTIEVPPNILNLPSHEEMAEIISLYNERSGKLSYKERIIGFRYQRSYKSCLIFDRTLNCTEALSNNNTHRQPQNYFGNKVLNILTKDHIHS